MAHLGYRAKEIEEELRKIQQKQFDAEFSEALTPGARTEELKYCEGYVDGVNWCLKNFF